MQPRHQNKVVCLLQEAIFTQLVLSVQQMPLLHSTMAIARPLHAALCSKQHAGPEWSRREGGVTAAQTIALIRQVNVVGDSSLSARASRVLGADPSSQATMTGVSPRLPRWLSESFINLLQALTCFIDVKSDSSAMDSFVPSLTASIAACRTAV